MRSRSAWCGRCSVYLATERAFRGASLLDDKMPGWAGRIDAAELDINQCANCVLGQLFDGYTDGLEELGLEHADAAAFGFEALRMSLLGHSGTAILDRNALTAAWLVQIAKRVSA